MLSVKYSQGRLVCNIVLVESKESRDIDYRVSNKNNATFNRYLFLYYNLNWYALNIYY